MTNYEIYACNELENKLKKIKSNSTFDYTIGLEAELKSSCIEIEKLKRALDKACEELHSKDLDGEESDFMKQYTVWSKDKWKEWALNND